MPSTSSSLSIDSVEGRDVHKKRQLKPTAFSSIIDSVYLSKQSNLFRFDLSTSLDIDKINTRG
mgnify:CR=1 FL=1|jgi:hypothetical protein